MTKPKYENSGYEKWNVKAKRKKPQTKNVLKTNAWHFYYLTDCAISSWHFNISKLNE